MSMTKNVSQNKLKRNGKRFCEEKSNNSNIFTTASAFLVLKKVKLIMNNKKWNNLNNIKHSD